MNMKNFLAAKGRYNRAKYWGYSILFGIFYFAIQMGLTTAMFMNETMMEYSNSIVGIINLIALIFLYVSFVFTIRRLHDLDKSGWMSLLMLVPFANIYLLIICGFFKGTEGENQYGADPLAK